MNSIEKIYRLAEERINNIHIVKFPNTEKPIFMISEAYPGVWLEHLYDSVMYAHLYPEKSEYLKNIITLFIENQSPEGQLPCYIFNSNKVPIGTECVGYGQIQEVLSFASVCIMAYEILKDTEFLKYCYEASKKWVGWLMENRMTQKYGLIEMFCGFDTGHDRSGRVCDISCPGNYIKGGVLQNASVLPPEDGKTPIIAVDMNANFFQNLISLAKAADILGFTNEAVMWRTKAENVKKLIFDLCLDKNDAFFYDVDKTGKMRKIKSSTIFHLFMEGVLDPNSDSELISEIYNRHIKNENEFWTPYPLPSTAYNDSTAKNHENYNSWGYFCQMLIYLRCTLWMDRYGFSDDFDYICKKVVDALTDNFDKIKLGQEIDPISGTPSPSSEWYSSCMLFYIYAVRRLYK